MAGTARTVLEEAATTTTVASGLTKQQTCEGVQNIHNAARQFRQDFALGKADTGRAFVLQAELSAREEALAAQTTDKTLAEAIRAWNARGGTDPKTRAEENVTYDARDKVDDLCGIPRTTREYLNPR